MLIRKMTVPLVLAAMLVGCSSGDDATTNDTNPGTSAQQRVGYLIDSPIQGVTYRCDGTTGVTSASGSFSCSVPPVSFSLGELTLGSISSFTSDNRVFPQDLLGLPRSDNSSTRLVELTRLIQSLDDDGNISETINILPSISALFDATANGASLEELANMAGVTLVSAIEAMEHLQQQTGTNLGGGDNATLAVIPASVVGSYVLEYSEIVSGSLIVDGSTTTIIVQADNALKVNADLTLYNPVFVGQNSSEAVWFDRENNLQYALSWLANGDFNEINVGNAIPSNENGFQFYGQYTEFTPPPTIVTPPATISNLELVTALSGQYTVATTSAGSHTRNSVTILADGSIDFDTGVIFPLIDIQTIYDRTFILAEPRIQLSYGANDDEDVINLYLDDNGAIAYIEYRNRNNGTLIKVDVSTQATTGNNNDCVVVSRISTGDSFVHRYADNAQSILTVTSTYNLVTNTETKVSTVTTGDASSTGEKTLTYTISNNYIYTTNIVSTDLASGFNIETTIAISPSRQDPIDEVCENQTWTSNVSMDTTIVMSSFPSSTVNTTESTVYLVESVDEQKTVSAGTYTTVKMKQDRGSETIITWTDIATGATVYQETKDTTGQVISTIELLQ